MKTIYKNKWYQKTCYGETHYGPEFYESDSIPIECFGGLIYTRMDYGYVVYDVVFNGICVNQMNGLNGAKLAAEKFSKGEKWE